MVSVPPSKVGGSLLSGLTTLDDVEVENQRVLVRTDLDVPLSKQGTLLDDSAIRRAVPTIKRLAESGARVIVCSTFGSSRRPAASGKAPSSRRGPSDAPAPSIEPAAARLSELSGLEVHLPDACVGDSVKKVLGDLREGQICVLENLLSHEEDERSDEAFARALLAYCDVYVNDALSSCEEESATTTLLPRLLEHRVTGPALLAELEAVARILSTRGPLTLVLGGSKLTDKLDILANLLPRTAHLCVAGVPANTLVRARGGAMGTSHVEDTYLAGARTLIEQTFSQLVLPQDFVVASSVKAARGHVVLAGELANDEAAVDLGPATLAAITEKIAQSAAVLWWGTIGFHKNPAFAEGTRALVQAMADSPAFTMAAGDDSVAAARATCPEHAERIGCLSGGGSATLALLSGKKLPGVEALRGMAND